MKINQINVSFKSLNNALTAQPQAIGADNPIRKKESNTISNTTPDYNVKVPMRYTSNGTTDLPCDTKGYLYKLENGQRVVIVPKEGPTVVKTYVNVGSMNEPDEKRGISHFIEHNLFNGSQGLEAGEFFATVNKMGANTNASTGFAATDYYIQSNLLKKNDLENQIKIHASMIETPKFAQEMIEKERGPVTSEINMILDDPENVAINNTLKLLFNIKSTSRDIIGGNVDNINNLTREDVVDYYNRNYYPSNMTTVITGDVKPEETMKLVSKYFQSRKPAPSSRVQEKLVPINKTVRNDFISDKTNSAILSIGFVGPKNNNTKDKILLDAFQFFMVGSSVARLNKSLEEIQTNAFISSDRISTKPNDNTVVLFSTSTSDSNIENAIKKVYSEIYDLEKNPPSDKEMEIVKKKLKLNLAQVFESSSLINTTIGTAMLDNDLKSVEDFEKVIDNMTPQDMVDFSKKYFDTKKVAITVVHPQSADLKSINKNYEKVHHVSFGSSELNHKKAIDESKINQYNLTNNMSLTTNNIEKDLTALDLSVSTPAPADVKPGVSDILAIMLNRGSKFADEKKFFTNLESKGIQAYFDASEDGITVNSMFLPDDSRAALQNVKEVLLNPRFTDVDFEYARQLVIETIKNESKHAKEGMMKEMFKGQLYGASNEDYLNSLKTVTLSDVKGLYNYIMQQGEAKTVVSGPFENGSNVKSDIMYELSTDFDKFKTYKPELFNSYVPVAEKSVVVASHNKSQAEIQMGYKFKTNANLKDNITFDLLNTILGGTPSSRLFSDLRETQKLAYQVSSKLNYFDNSGVLSMYIKTTTDEGKQTGNSYANVQKSIDGFNSHIVKMMNENVSEEELESAKLTLKNKVLNYSELTSDKNALILNGVHSFYGATNSNKTLEMIDKITIEDVKTAANYIFNSNPTISIVATKNTLEDQKKYLQTLGNYKA